MKTRIKVLALGLTIACMSPFVASAQQPAPGASLGDVARQLKAQKAAKDSKTPVVMTNDSIADVPKDNGVTVAAPPKKGSGDSVDTATKPEKGHDAEYFRSQQSKLQDKLGVDQRELAVMQQKLGQNNMQYYSNPQDALLQQYSRSDIDKLTAQIDAKKQQIDDDNQAMSDLRDQLRREGGDPGWLR